MGFHSGPASAISTEHNISPSSNIEAALLCLLPSVQGIKWDTGAKATIKAACVQLEEVCWATHQVALPVDVTEARIEVGHVLLFNFDQSMEHVCYMLVEHFRGTMIVHASDIVEF